MISYGYIEVIALVCLMVLATMYFIVQLKEKLKLKILVSYFGQSI